MRLVRTESGGSLIQGDCVEALRKFKDHRFDSCVSDPPYEMGFMGKKWDRTGIAYSVDMWREVLRTLKPGAHLLAFGGARTYHRMACAIEDAGFEIRDSLHWFYGTGFPKSLNVGDGRGTALKPGHEPIVLARKPLEGTVAANVAAHGTGALNIDATRIAAPGGRPLRVANAGPDNDGGSTSFDVGSGKAAGETSLGRWPANVLLDPDAAAELDAQTADLKPGGAIGAETAAAAAAAARRENVAFRGHDAARGEWVPHGDSGGASRFFYVAKPGRAERDIGCEDLPPRTGGEATDREDDSKGVENPRAGAGRTGGARNYHPTVKPVALMRYLVRLITPKGGMVCDPFAGSGTTGMAARLEGAGFVGIEREAEFVEIARRRIGAAHRLLEAA